MRDLGTANAAYVAESNGYLPREDAKGTDTFYAAADPENSDAWYNALPRLMNKPSVKDFTSKPEKFYTKDNPLFVPGAGYPNENKRLRKPWFAIAINSKLQRMDPLTGKKPVLKASMIENAARTPLLLEQGLPDEWEDGGVRVQKKSDYDGSPKGTAKSFVGRHFGYGWILFVDGHVEKFEPGELLTKTGDFYFPPNTGGAGLIWGRNSEEDPNK